MNEKRSKAGKVSAKRRKNSTCVEHNSTCGEESATCVEKNATSVEENPTSVQHNSTKESKLKDIKVNETKLNDTILNDTIVEETKVKKDKNSKPVSVFNFRKVLLDYGFHEELVDEWLAIRKNKRSVNSEFAYNSFIAQVERAGVEKTSCREQLQKDNGA